MKKYLNRLRVTNRRSVRALVSMLALMVGAMLCGVSAVPSNVLADANDADIAFDGFESKDFEGGNGWLDKWKTDGNVKLIKMKPYEGKRYAKIMGGKNAGRIERAVDLSQATSVRLKFAGRVRSFEGNDKAYVKVSSDGSNYTVVAEFTAQDSDNTWHLHDIDLADVTLSDDFRIVFEGAMSRKLKDKWYLDNIVIVESGSGVTFNLDTDVLGQGSVSLNPTGGTYSEGAEVELTAQAATGWVFDHWEGDATGTANPAMVVMDSDKTATAVFVQTVTYNLDTTTIGQGSIDLDPSGGVYSEGAEVELTAQAATGWVFDHWEGDVTGTANPATMVMDNDKTATAVFVQAVSYNLGTTTNGQGSISLNPAGGQYTVDTVVTLTANPAPGWEFAGWTGDVSGMTNPATVVMTNDKTVEASFVETSHETWKFIIYGDTRSNDSAHRSVLRSIVNNTPDYRFLVNVGDVVNDGSSTSQWNTWQRAVDDILGGSGQDSVPPKYMAVIGNHDASGMSNWRRYLPGQNQQFGNGGQFFTFDYGNARFVLLNSEQSLTGAQLTMLKRAINENPKTWLFTVWHKPIFPFGSKGYESGIHRNWGVPLYNGGADIMFMGHAHYYVRTGKIGMNGNSRPPMDNQYGTAQVVTGVGGAPLYSVSPNADGYGYMAESYVSRYGYTELTVEGDTLTLKQILSNGSVFDTMTYRANPKNQVSDDFFDNLVADGVAEQIEPAADNVDLFEEDDDSVGEEEAVEAE